MFKEPARHSVCPCESGKKYKSCCSVNLDIRRIISKVTTKPVLDLQESSIIKDDKEIFIEISHKMNNGGKDFKNYLKELIPIKERNPDERRIYNLITVCYNRLGENQQAVEMLKETYRMFPDYLFAKTSLMRSILHEGDHRKYVEIFGDKVFDLQTLYPERKEFHISEALDFYNVVGIYFAREGKFYLSRQCLKVLFALAPDNQLVHQLDEELYSQISRL